MSLLKELSKGSMQTDLKTSDGSSAGTTDVSKATDDVGFSLMRNMINKDGQVTGSNVNDYLERAQDLNDEVESVGFAVETDDGDIIKIYVNATEADKFEEALSKLLGLEGDTEEAINQLAQEFDIVDVVWPRDPEGDDEAEADPDADLSIDDMELDTEEEGDDTATADMPVEPDAEIDAAAAADVEAPAEDEIPADEAPLDDEGFEDIPPKPEGEEEPEGEAEGEEEPEEPEEEPEEEMEPVLNDDGTQKLDKDGNPVMRKKAEKKPEVTEEGLKGLRKLAEAARDEMGKHIKAVIDKGNTGKWMIMKRVSGGIAGLKTAPLKQDGEVIHFDNEEQARAEAEKLTKKMNGAGATASYTYIPKLVEDKQPQAKDNSMTIGSKFLDRLFEAEDKDAVKDGMNIPLDAQQKALVSQLKRPLEKKIVAFFAMCGIIGRLLNQEADVVDSIRTAGDVLRKNATARNTFNTFYSSLATAKGFAIKPEVNEAIGKLTPVKGVKADNDEESLPKENTEKSKKLRGSMMQKKLEAVMIALGLPRALVTTDGPGQLAPYLHKTAMTIDSDSNLEHQLRMLATRLGVKLNEAVAVTVNDPFAKDVLALLRAIGVPEEHLSYKPNDLRAALIGFGKSLTNRALVDNRIEQLLDVISKGKRVEKKVVQQESLTEAFGELEALVDSDMTEHDVLEPNGGPAMKAFYDGAGTHSETVLLLGVDPERDGNKNLKVSVDGPWDGTIHARYFPNDKDGYKAALQYANQLRSANLKSGGRPKGWK
jgi:hypothetical protein